jgi:hypothetical protein
MNPRCLLSLLLLILVPALVGAQDGKKVTAGKRPNILFLFADDWGRYASAYAKVEGRPSPNQVVRTPNIDRLAREGVLFRNAFVNAPSCTPSRSALLSGRYFFKTGRGAILQGAVWDASSAGFSVRWTMCCGLTFLIAQTSVALGGPKNRCAAPSRQP